MPPITHVLVTAVEGRLVPIPPSEGSAAGAAILTIEPGKVYRLPWSTYTRKRLAGGDLELVNAKTRKPRGKGEKPATPEEASVKVDLKITATGELDADQRPDTEINAERAKAAELEAKKNAAAPTSDGKDR